MPAAARINLFFIVLLTAGCAGMDRAPHDELPGTGAVQKEAPAPAAAPPQPVVKQDADVAAKPSTPPASAPAASPVKVDAPAASPVKVDAPAPSPVKADAPAPSSVKVDAPAPSSVKIDAPAPSPVKVDAPAPSPVKADAPVPSSVKAGAPAAQPPAKVPASPAPKEAAPKQVAAAPPAPKPTAPPLDLGSLEKRLKETPAIGVFTKLTLKNQVDDLLDQFRAYYQGRAKITLAALRQPYDQLILKVLSLLQDSDPPLARAITESREAIWGILSDPAKFNNL